MIDTGFESLPSPKQREISSTQALNDGGKTSFVGGSRVDNVDAEVKGIRAKLDNYKGEIGDEIRRGATSYEAEWNREKEFFNRTFDQFVSSAIENAIAQGRKDVLIFDFGCGQAIAFEDFLAQSDSKAHQLIRENPDIQIKLLGLTDTAGISNTPEGEALIQGRDLKSPQDEPENLSAHVDYYFVTKEQSLEKYFEEKGITKVDGIMAVQSFPYLAAKDFDAVLTTMIDRLHPQGELIAAPYATRAPGFARDSSIIGGKPRLAFDDPTLDLDPELVPILKEKGMRFALPDVDVNQEGEHLKKAFDFFIKQKSLSQEDVDNRINEFLPQRIKLWNRLKRQRPHLEQLYGKGKQTLFALSNIAGLLIDAEEKLGIMRLDTLAAQKKDILAQLKTQHSEDAEIIFGKDVIHIKKK